MADTIFGAGLTEAHRREQSSISNQIIAGMLQAWAVIDQEDLDNSFVRWLGFITPMIRTAHRSSTESTATYLAQFRAVEGISGSPAIRTAGTLATARIKASMTATLLAPARTNLRRMPPARALETARVGSSRAAGRLVLSGGRDTLIRTVDTDRQALGYARATSGSPCHFCAMLASRGPVYGERSSQFQAHDGCNCSGEPVYSRDTQWPAGAEQHQELWRQASEGRTPAEARREFRRRFNS